MLKDNVIQPSNSDYVSKIVMVKKKMEEWKFYIDYRPLNTVTIQDKYLLPLIRDTWVTALDLRSSYYQILIEPNSYKYTVF